MLFFNPTLLICSVAGLTISWIKYWTYNDQSNTKYLMFARYYIEIIMCFLQIISLFNHIIYLIYIIKNDETVKDQVERKFIRNNSSTK